MPKVFWPVLTAAALHAAWMALYLAAFHGDWSALVCVAQEHVGHFPYESISRGFPTGGYDGQYYYAIARAPWRTQTAGIDSPGARQLRILYPALAWLFSGGQGRLLLLILPLVNLGAVTALAWLGARMALRNGLSAWWGFVLPAALNTGLPALRNLTDPLAALALFGLLAAWLQGASVMRLSIWAAAAVFSREQTAAILGIILAFAVRQRRLHAAAGLIGILGCWLAWVGLLRGWYGTWPFLPGQGNFAAPFSGMVYRWTHLTGGSGSHFSTLAHALRMTHLTALTFLAAYLVRRGNDPVISAVTLAGVLLAVLAGVAIYADAWSYTRVFTWLPMGIWLGSVRTRSIPSLLVLLPAFGWPLIGIVQAWQS